MDLPPKDEIPPYLVEDLEEEQELEELALEKFEYAWIEDAKFVVYTTPYPANNCDSWCGLTAYRLEFKGGMGAKLAYLALVPPNIPRTARCTQLGYSRGHELSANGLGDIASGVFCADEAYEAITYEWVSENLVTGVMVSGYRDRLDKGEVKAFTDKLYNDSKNLFQKEKFQ